MNMHLFDWTIVVVLFSFITIMAYKTKKYTESVADFLAANRCAKRYLLGIAAGTSGLGAITVVAYFQQYYQIGLAASWWSLISSPLSIAMYMSGWLLYRYRQTRAMTLAQFFEMRYSKRFRIFAGLICFVSGIINFGIFPAVGAIFFTKFCGFPDSIILLGISVPVFPLLMAVLIGIALYFAFLGGQIAVMVTDFLQGMFCNIAVFSLILFLLFKFPLSDVFDTLQMAPQNHSMVNPFKISGIEDFDVWYFAIGWIGLFYNRLSWQGSQGYYCSALNAHEAKMGSVIGEFREWAFLVALILIPLCAYTVMHNPKYADMAAQVNAVLSKIPNEEVQNQMTTPVCMTAFLPAGLMGAFAAVMFAAFVSNCTTYLHSWGTILVQDVVLPFRKKPLSTDGHLKLLRLSICAVAAFIFIFSMVFRQTERIYLFFALTGAIWMGGAGAIIIGGLYWKKGTTLAAYVSLIMGSGIAFAGIICGQIWKPLFGVKFPINGQWVYLTAMIAAGLSYMIVSLLTAKGEVFNLDSLLHRGKYADSNSDVPGPKAESRWSMKSILGFTNEFTIGDKFIYSIAFSRGLLLFGIMLVVTSYAFYAGMSDKQWSDFQRYLFWFQIVTGFIIFIWLSIGGLFNLRDLFVTLKSAKRNAFDDGTVQHEPKNVRKDTESIVK